MGHVGLTPQSLNTIGGFRQGRVRGAAVWLMPGRRQAGAFAVLGAIVSRARDYLSRADSDHRHRRLARSDGQILVLEDMLG
jgi:ketopantoate hydroxymethyltransferase